MLTTTKARSSQTTQYQRPAPTLRGVFEPAGTLPTPTTVGLLRADGRVLIFGCEWSCENGLGSLASVPEAVLLFDVESGQSLEIGTTAASVDYAVMLSDGRALTIEPQPAPVPGLARAAQAERN